MTSHNVKLRPTISSSMEVGNGYLYSILWMDKAHLNTQDAVSAQN